MGVFKKLKGDTGVAAALPVSGGGDGGPGRAAAYRRTLGAEAPPQASTGAAGGPQQGAPPEPGRFIKTGSPRESKYRRAAKFLILIGRNEVARILSGLPPREVELIGREIATVRGITDPEAAAILEEFRALRSAPPGAAGASAGGVEAARRLLYRAFGPALGESVLVRAVPQSRKNPFAFLEDFSGEQIAFLLKDESVAAAALVLSRLSPQKSAAALAPVEGERKTGILRRIARMERTSPEVLERAAGALREKSRLMAAADTVRLDGLGALTAILKAGDSAFGERLLQELEDRDNELGRYLKERLYTLEDLVKAEDRPVQEKLRSMPDRDIALLLWGRSSAFAAKVFANLSTPRAEAVREEGALMGTPFKAEVDAVARDFLRWFRLNREEGRIILIDDEDVL